MSALPSSTANWHWKNKNVSRWGKEWFERELIAVSISGEGQQTAKIINVAEVDGDVELGQRKSKLITIFDCRLAIEWVGTAADGSEVKGTLNIPEVSHENTLDGSEDYVYQWSLTSQSSAESQAILKLVKDKFPHELEQIFQKFPQAIIDTHGKDLTVSNANSGTSTPTSFTGYAPAPPGGNASSSGPAVKKAEAPKGINTTTITSESHFMAAADDLFNLLTDEKRIPSWTRAPARSEAKENTDYSLFGGGVKGRYLSLAPPNKFIQSWILSSPTWPEGHSATLTTTLEQGADSTKVTWNLSGVPTGMEEEIKRNIEGYYVHGLKSIGLGTVL